MPAATSKAELLDVFDSELAKLNRLLDSLAEDQSAWSDDGVSIKAIIGHRAHWLDLYWSWYDKGAAGGAVETPAPGFKWNQLKAYNAPIYAAADEQSWSDLRTRFEKASSAFRERLTALPSEELYAKGRFAWTNDWTLGRWAESAGPSHFRSAAKAVRKILRNQS